MRTRTLSYSDETIARAAAHIGAGEPVAVPTETVYGLAADATSDAAVAAIYAAKGRPQFNPLIVHFADLASARVIGHFDDRALRLAEAHWPGPLTLVVPLMPRANIARLATAGLRTIGLRVPAHRAMQALLARARVPLAAPSANASGTISPTTAAHVSRTLGGRIPIIIDDGPTPGGIESTIVAVANGEPRLLRPGPILVPGIVGSPSDTIEAPGQLDSHYAPSKPLRLNAHNARTGEWLIGFGAIRGQTTLSAIGDTIEAASQLFSLLHQADQSDCAAIAVAPIPETGLGIAINDRLRRAAAGSGRL